MPAVEDQLEPVGTDPDQRRSVRRVVAVVAALMLAGTIAAGAAWFRQTEPGDVRAQSSEATPELVPATTPEHVDGYVATRVPAGFEFSGYFVTGRGPAVDPALGDVRIPTVQYDGGGEPIAYITVTAMPGETEDRVLALETPHMRDRKRVTVQGRDAIFYGDSVHDVISVKWVPEEGVGVQVNARGLTESQLLAVAEAVRPSS